MCVCVWLVFYVIFNNLSVISRRWLLVAWDAICSRVLSAVITDAPCRRHKTQIHHPVTLSWHRANQSWFYPLIAERLARKQPVSIFTSLVWCVRGSNLWPPDSEANALSTRPPRRLGGKDHDGTLPSFQMTTSSERPLLQYCLARWCRGSCRTAHFP